MGTGGNNVPYVSVRAVLTPEREEKRQNGRQIKEDGEPSFTLTAQDRHGVLIINEATKKGYAEAMEGDGVDLEYIDSKTRRGRVKKGHSHTLMANAVHHVVQKSTLRKLTPLECERLQGLPDNWTKWYKDGSLVPDSQRYERCGRAVTVNVIEQIARRFPI
jgi:DNA (cytosine-5)-methyltransferase 1